MVIKYRKFSIYAKGIKVFSLIIFSARIILIEKKMGGGGKGEK